MKQTFDTDSILFALMKSTFKNVISGGVYIMRRPNNSFKEDVVVNTITVSQEFYPQLAASNVNIHVPNLVITIDGAQQSMPDNARLKVLSEMALNALRMVKLDGMSLSIDFQKNIEEEDIKQTYVNIRISFTINA